MTCRVFHDSTGQPEVCAHGRNTAKGRLDAFLARASGQWQRKRAVVMRRRASLKSRAGQFCTRLGAGEEKGNASSAAALHPIRRAITGLGRFRFGASSKVGRLARLLPLHFSLSPCHGGRARPTFLPSPSSQPATPPPLYHHPSQPSVVARQPQTLWKRPYHYLSGSPGSPWYLNAAASFSRVHSTGPKPGKPGKFDSQPRGSKVPPLRCPPCLFSPSSLQRN